MSKTNLQKIVTVVGEPGLFHLKDYNNKGYFLQPMEGGNIRFFANAHGRVLALGNIDLATTGGSINLMDLFNKMFANTILIPSAEADSSAVWDFFLLIVPELDPKKVAYSHLLKVLTWFFVLHAALLEERLVNEKDDGLTIV
jgi:hypothetical protein